MVLFAHNIYMVLTMKLKKYIDFMISGKKKEKKTDFIFLWYTKLCLIMHNET